MVIGEPGCFVAGNSDTVAQQRRNWQERFGRTAADRLAEGRHANPRQSFSRHQPISRDHARRSAGPGVENIEQPICAYEVEAQDVAFDNQQLTACI